MADDAGFMHAIRAAPADDLPRLAYADYLDERGDPRGRFIQVQCALARLDASDPRRGELADEEWALLNKHHAEWLGGVPAGVEAWEFRRGFVEAIRPTCAAWVEHGAALCGRWLLREVVIDGDRGRDGGAAFARAWPTRAAGQQIERLELHNTGFSPAAVDHWLTAGDLDALRSLRAFNWGPEDDEYAIVAGSPRLAGLRELGLYDSTGPLAADAARDLLAALPTLDTLDTGRELDATATDALFADRGRWRAVYLHPDNPTSAAGRLLTGDSWPRLERLSLPLPDVFPTEPRRATPLWPRLTHLTWQRGPRDPGRVGAFLRRNAPRLAVIGDCPTDFALATPAQQAAFLADLRTLPIERLMLPGTGPTVAALAAFPRLATYFVLGDADWRPLAAGGWRGPLRRLVAGQMPPLTPGGRPALAFMETLAVWSQNMTRADADHLAAWLDADALPRLRSLTFRTHTRPLTATVVAALVRWPRLPSLRRLELRTDDEPTLTTLLACPRLSPLCDVKVGRRRRHSTATWEDTP